MWDVRANVGRFSFCAGLSGSVLAIEPDLWLAHLLQHSARRLARGRRSTAAPVAVVCAAVAEQTGVSELQIAERGRAANHLGEIRGSSQVGGNRYSQETITVSLDFLLEHFPPPSVVKSDAEAAEVQVLRGPARLLRTARPIIWCEFRRRTPKPWQSCCMSIATRFATLHYLPLSAQRCVAPHGTR